MISNNTFNIKRLRSIVFIGYSKVYKELIDINTNLGIDSKIITSTDQSKTIKQEYKIFDKIDDNFYSYIKQNFKIEETLFISLGSRLIFNSEAVEFFKNNLINFHGTRLPYDSGGGGFSWKIMRQDRIDNQLVHVIDSGIDTGPIIHYQSSIYPKDCIIPLDFENYSLKKFLNFYSTFIKNIKSGESFKLKAQLDYLGRYNPRLSTKDNSFINWDWDYYELYNFINSFDEPYSGSQTFINRGDFGPVSVKSVHLHGGDSLTHPYMSGLIYRHDKDWVVVSTSGKYSLLIEKVIDSDGNDILKKLKPGDRFYTPREVLDNSNSKRIIYNSKGKK